MASLQRLSTEVGSSRNEELDSGEADYSGCLMEGGVERLRVSALILS